MISPIGLIFILQLEFDKILKICHNIDMLKRYKVKVEMQGENIPILENHGTIEAIEGREVAVVENPLSPLFEEHARQIPTLSLYFYNFEVKGETLIIKF